MEVETKKFEVGDIWLCDEGDGLPFEATIKEIKGNYIRGKYWYKVEEWNDMAKVKIGETLWKFIKRKIKTYGHGN